MRRTKTILATLAGGAAALLLIGSEAARWDARRSPGLDDLPGLNTLTVFSSGVTYWIAAEEAVAWGVPASAGDRN